MTGTAPELPGPRTGPERRRLTVSDPRNEHPQCSQRLAVRVATHDGDVPHG